MIKVKMNRIKMKGMGSVIMAESIILVQAVVKLLIRENHENVIDFFKDRIEEAINKAKEEKHVTSK